MCQLLCMLSRGIFMGENIKCWNSQSIRIPDRLINALLTLYKLQLRVLSFEQAGCNIVIT